MPDHFDPYHVWLGIPPEESAGGKPNHYRLRGLRPFETNPDAISNALDQRRVFLRSVQAGKRGAQSQQLLNEVSAAGVTLLDAEKKKRYDDELRKQLAPPPVPLPQEPAASAPIVRTTPSGGRGKKRPSSSLIIGAIAFSCVGALLLLAAVGAWWARNLAERTNVAA